MLLLLIAPAEAPARAAEQTEASKPADRTAVARQFVESLRKKEYAGAAGRFDAVMRKAMPPEKLQEVWEGILGGTGPFQETTGVRTEKAGKFTIVLVTCRFEKAALDVKVVFGEGNDITGLWFAPAGAGKYVPPAYVKRDAFEEKEVRVGSGLWVLPGTLCLPKGTGPFAAVVLVHGSGPNDRDETIGPNRPFRDLAWGLASRGIAVLRYEKRTKEHPLKLVLLRNSLTVKQETIDDALAAVALVRKTERIDPKRVFVLGHSLGGMLVPRIGRLDPQITGFIVFAGSTRPLEDIVLDQLNYIFSLDGRVSEAEQPKLDKVKQQVARVKDPKLSASTPAGDLPLGIPAAYWLDLRGYDPPKEARKLKQPMLILQGERDYQVTMEDFRAWKEALSSRKDVVLKSYPKCNHLFVEGQGKSTPAEYQKPGHVAEEAIKEIADWIGEHYTGQG